MKTLLAIALILISICGNIEARIVKGKVTCGDEKLSGVIVTDGKNFTTTRNNGTFRLDVDENQEFVYIVTPSGYTGDWKSGVPQFYIKAKGQKDFHFELQKMGDNDSDYSIIAVGDPQPRKMEHFIEFAGEPLEDMVQHIAGLDTPAVGIVLGDITHDVLPLMKNWKKEITRTGIPFYPVAGNHDHDEKNPGDATGIGVYRKNFGPENYAFGLGKDFVIVLDDIIYHSRSGYDSGYTDEIISWVSELLEYIPLDSDIYIAQHCPLNGRNYSNMVTNHDKMLEILKGRKVTFLSGHNHSAGIFEYAPGITEHNVAAICGTWWDTYHCKDGTPKGYKVFIKKDGELSWYYKSIGKDVDFQYEIFGIGEGRLNPECIIVNIWDYDPLWSVTWSEDGKEMGEMKQVQEYSPIHAAELKAKYDELGREPSKYRQTDSASHYFAVKPSSDAKTVTISIKNRFGHSWTETIKL